MHVAGRADVPGEKNPTQKEPIIGVSVKARLFLLRHFGARGPPPWNVRDPIDWRGGELGV